MRYIFLDTNIFHDQWHLQSADFKALAKIINNSQSTLLISDIVCSEVENNYNKNRDEAIHDLKRSAARVQNFNLEKKSLSFDHLIQPYDFRKSLQETIKFVEFLDYHDIPQKEVVDRALKNILPFRESEKGYRDTLIWLSLLRSLMNKSKHDMLIFITRNHKDFLAKDDRGHLILQPALEKDIKDNNVEVTILPYTSLTDFVKENIQSDGFEYSATMINEDHILPHYTYLEDWIVSHLNDMDTSDFKKLLDQSNVHFPYISALVDHGFFMSVSFDEALVQKYGRASSNTLYVNAKFIFHLCGIQFLVPAGDFSADKKAIAEKFYRDVIPREDEVYFLYDCEPEVELSFILNTETEEILDLELISLNFVDKV